MELRRTVIVPSPHDLLRLETIDGLVSDEAPCWVAPALATTPWVVVRRAEAPAESVAVGVRGIDRSQRHALAIPITFVAAVTRPEDLVSQTMPAREVPAFHALTEVQNALAKSRLSWGPVGSVGFELATGAFTVGAASDLDLIVRVDAIDALTRTELVSINSQLQDLSARVDCQVETPAGAISLSEFCSESSHVLLRSTCGPKLVAFDELIA